MARIGDSPFTVAAVVPAHNESQSIGATIDALRRIPGNLEIVVVDDGSSDETQAIAQARGVRVLRLARRRGKGGALRLALKCLSLEGYDAFLLVDADLGAEAQKAERLLNSLLADEGDMVIGGVKVQEGTGGFGLVAAIARRITKFLTGTDVTWPLSGQRAFKSSVWSRLDTVALGFGFEIALTIDAIRAGFKVREIQTDMMHSGDGKSLRGLIHRGIQLLHICYAALPRLFGRAKRRESEF
ncbi:MAG TPA: glycosyltransferase family 2 protein [Clostridia bacterium]|nr:glycosyltransferase family 2 protein [Clostridia bacterium]